MEKINSETYEDSITKLPNRRKMFKDLYMGKFHDSIIIIIQINNFIKLQNIYGHMISNKLIMYCAEFLIGYRYIKNSYVYKYSHDSYAIKYKFDTDEKLEKFIKELHYNLETYNFNLDDGVDVLLDITIGVSDPKNLNNSVDELKEAEIA
ncbi:MAG: diguanylate cyclase [Campylobacterales bacterium]|nr:diguanylate cyclase [Campylobacterales bacterium]